jgi:hypothetical protein
MKTPTPPYHNVTDQLLYTLLTGGDCIGYEKITVDSALAVGLDYPEATVYALLVVEADLTSADKSKVIRFLETPFLPTATEGIPLGDLSVYEVKGKPNLKNFRAIGIEAGKNHSIAVQYFG